MNPTDFGQKSLARHSILRDVSGSCWMRTCKNPRTRHVSVQKPQQSILSWARSHVLVEYESTWSQEPDMYWCKNRSKHAIPSEVSCSCWARTSKWPRTRFWMSQTPQPHITNTMNGRARVIANGGIPEAAGPSSTECGKVGSELVGRKKRKTAIHRCMFRQAREERSMVWASACKDGKAPRRRFTWYSIFSKHMCQSYDWTACSGRITFQSAMYV